MDVRQFIAIPRARAYTDTIRYVGRLPMSARIYKPSKTAMQSGQANTKAWYWILSGSCRGVLSP